jgi:hypothetical protein
VDRSSPSSRRRQTYRGLSRPAQRHRRGAPSPAAWLGLTLVRSASRLRGFALPLALLLSLLGLGARADASSKGGDGVIARMGVKLDAPRSWGMIERGDAGIVDPTTVLVAGSPGVRPLLHAGCQIAAYRVPASGAVVVVVRWRTVTSGGGRPPVGRAPLKTLTRVRRPSFECFEGRGAAAQLSLGGHAYQVNVMVGDRATPRSIRQALSVARSFRLSVTHRR